MSPYGELERMAEHLLGMAKGLVEFVNDAMERDELHVGEARRVSKQLREAEGWLSGARQRLEGRF